jgi:hypothetical protein
MSAVREKDSADYDLDRFVELFDEALTSNDPRVKNALRQLMMMVILTSNEHEDRVRAHSHREGPLRRMQEDVRDMATRMHKLDEQIRRMEFEIRRIDNQPPAGYHGGMGGGEKWPTVFKSSSVYDPNTAQTAKEYFGQAIPGISEEQINQFLDQKTAKGLYNK